MLRRNYQLKATLGRVYSFSLSPRSDENGNFRHPDILACEVYGRQTLDSIVCSGGDPFHHRLRQLWLDVYREPWNQPRNLEELLTDLAAKIGTGELKVYKDYDPTWEGLPKGANSRSASSDSIASAQEVDGPRTQTKEAGSLQKGGNESVAPTAAAAGEGPEEVEARKRRYQEREQLIEETSDNPDVQEANERLTLNNNNVIRAEAADYIYKVDEYKRGHIDELPEPPDGLNPIDPKEVAGLEGATFNDEETGFGAALIESEINNERMLAFRGTNNGVTGKKDWSTNFRQGLGMKTGQYDQAMDLAKLVNRNSDSSVSLVGHSLGGGLASAGVAVTGQPGYTFNSAGLHPNTAARQGGMSNADAAKNITTQTVDGEALQLFQKHGGQALGAGVGALGGGLLSGAAGAAAGASLGSLMAPEIPNALGENHSLPSVEGGGPVDRHGMDQVISGIEHQKEQDIHTLQQAR